jgi:voltage-gated potassium channel
MPLEPIQSLRLRLVLPLTLVLGVMVVGTLGYAWLWRDQGGSLLDALFMTVITITTIGYEEVRPLDSPGRIFTIFIAITGVGSLFYSFGVVMEYVVSSRILDPSGRRRVQREIEQLSNHIVIAGLGRVGRQAALELQEAGTPFVVVDPELRAREYAEGKGYRFVLGDATEDEVLERAGVHRAFGLIVTTGSDANNLYTVLSARALSPRLHIVSRAIDEAGVAKLIRAAANRAISPYVIGGRRLAHLILSPTVIDFFDTILKKGEESLSIEDIEVGSTSPVVGQSLESLHVLERSGASVLAVLRGGQPFANPEPGLVLQSGDRLLALGTSEQLARLVDLAGGEGG